MDQREVQRLLIGDALEVAVLLLQAVQLRPRGRHLVQLVVDQREPGDDQDENQDAGDDEDAVEAIRLLLVHCCPMTAVLSVPTTLNCTSPPLGACSETCCVPVVRLASPNMGDPSRFNIRSATSR